MSSVYFSVLVLFPLFTFCFINSVKIILLLFTEKWLNASVAFQAFCIIFAFIILGIPQKNVIVLSNYAKWWFQLQIKISLIIVPLTAVSAFFGLNALLVMLILGKFLYCSLSMWKSCQILALDIKSYIISFLSPFVCCIFTALTTTLITQLIPPSKFILVDITISAIIFFITYSIQILLFDRKKIVRIGLILLPNNQYLKKLAVNINN